ncbi:hypothetical protein [Lachnoclostridium edouardi]|uniref:hypothetical protein n=1 Tax=Lachnoclostridium edouardi TaxID=1926283 RepID=UPI000C7DB6E9|nr:hypothetical protein [Lachnoclostridium edouardi]
MQEFLTTGQALYVLAGICGLGVFCKWVTRILYKRLIKESKNVAMTKNKNLKMLKQRVESTYRTNSGIHNMSTYLEHQMTDFKFLGVTLTGWGNFSNQMTLLCFIAGGAASFLSYWYRSDSYYIILYGSMGILGGLFTMFVDSGVNLNEKRGQLLIALEDYMDNSLFFRPGKGRMVYQEEASETARSGSRETLRERVYAGTEPNEEDNQEEFAGKEGREAMKARTAAARRSSRRREAVRAAGKEGGRDGSREMSGEPGLGREMEGDSLKHSLEQIAASRDKGKLDQNWLKDLNPDEVRLIGEIIKEYLA